MKGPQTKIRALCYIRIKEHCMERTELTEAIRKVCEIQNDIRIDMRVRGKNWYFDAAYIFLGEKEVYVTDALYIISIDELDTESLNRIYQKIVLK
jgi:hypothetical protein